MERVIFADYLPGFLSGICVFLYASFDEKSRVGNSNVPLLRVLRRKTTHDQIHNYNIKHLQYIPVKNTYLELCQLTSRSTLGGPSAVTIGLAMITFHFSPIDQRDG